MSTSTLHSRRRTFKQQTQPAIKRAVPRYAHPRDVTLDILRIIACFAVVLQHSTAGALVGYGAVPQADWWIANSLNALSRFAVPVFLMMSGALLINRPGMDALRFYQRRAGALLKPYLFGSLIYLLYLLYAKHTPLSTSSILDRLQAGGIYYHFYYLHLIFGLYLLAPFLVIRSQRDMTAAILISFLLFFLSQLELHDIDIYMLNPGTGFFAHLPYFLLGSALFHLQKRVSLWLPALLFIAASAGIALGTHEQAQHLGIFTPSWFQKSTGWLPMMQACAVFLFFCQLIPRIQSYFRPNWRRQLYRFARATFGIYIYHVAVVELLYPALLRLGTGHLGAMLLTTMLTFLLTGGVILFIQRTALLRGWI